MMRSPGTFHELEVDVTFSSSTPRRGTLTPCAICPGQEACTRVGQLKPAIGKADELKRRITSGQGALVSSGSSRSAVFKQGAGDKLTGTIDRQVSLGAGGG